MAPFGPKVADHLLWVQSDPTGPPLEAMREIIIEEGNMILALFPL